MNLKRNEIKLCGRINFDPPDKTNKHMEQSSWKRVAVIVFDCEVCEYYSWFINKRFNIKLLKPIRGAHITFINDKEKDTNGNWEDVKDRWNSKTIEVILNVEPKTDSAEFKKSKQTHNWWLNIPEEHRDEIQSIRNELNLGTPYFTPHMTIGRAENFKIKSNIGAARAKNMNVEQSIYIHNLIKKRFIKF